MPVDSDSIAAQLPSYLTQEAKEHLAGALNAFPDCGPYYIDRYKTEVLQGDGWSHLEIVRFEDGARRPIRGILLSNSCDIDPANPRPLPARLVFAPIVKLARYADKLRQAGVAADRLENTLAAIREQRVTSLFYLPAGGRLDDEYIAILDDLHNVPYPAFAKSGGREKLFTLSQVGFYLFLFKLSVHFCRFHENVPRFDDPVVPQPLP